MSENKNIKRQPRQAVLETANEMYKQAFLVKRTRLAVANSAMSDAELDRMTVLYFSKLKEKK